MVNIWQASFLLLIRCIIIMCLLIKPGFANSAASTHDYLSQLAAQAKPSEVYGKVTDNNEAVKFYFAGEPYQGKPTRVFAIYNTPKNAEAPFPAVVLVHGGGGSAYDTWVKKWNDAGFAAISIAVEGQTGTRATNTSSKWQKHKWAGPARTNIYGDSVQPLRDQWMFHASSAVIRAHNLLRSFTDVDKSKIGLSGISWGGVITSTVLGFDQRFAFAVPIYGCGNLDGMDNQYGKALKNNDLYRDFWEPNLRIAKYEGPTLWLTGLHEQHFSLAAQARTYQTVTGSHQVSIIENLKHSHGAGWAPQEPYEFAQTVVNKRPFTLRFGKQKLNNNQVEIALNTLAKVTKTSLWVTEDIGHTGQRAWQQLTAEVVKQGDQLMLSGNLPEKTQAWFFNVELDSLTYSSDFSQRH